MNVIVAWVNFICMNIAGTMMIYTYIISLNPATREETRGEIAWKECARYRWYSNFCEWILIANIILWIWFPIPILNWKVHTNILVGIIIAIVIAVPCSLVLLKGTLDAGAETFGPLKEGTVLNKGIYKYIRHPQTIGEMPLFIAGSFLINSLFLVIWWSVYIVLYIIIIIPFEEKELIKRFGNAYIEYKKITGAFLPKIRKKKS